DNTLFEPIDNRPLMPSAEQVALYAYRSLCREFFVKENAVRVLTEAQKSERLPSEHREMMKAMLQGTTMGFRGLKFHKQHYDIALRERRFDDFRYITFISESRCSLQLSGLLYPDFDFLGRPLNDLSDWSSPPGLITAFTAPAADGWSYTFAWHGSSDAISIPFIQSLMERVATGSKLEDLLLRFSLSSCENHAIRISWWDALPAAGKMAILGRFSLMLDPDSAVPPNYLVAGCEGLADWEFEHCYTNLEVGPNG
ncbi:hypothetical protein, partial [Pseudomonas paraeruginosa]